MTASFDTVIRAFGNNAGIEVPPAVLEQLGGGKRPRVLVPDRVVELAWVTGRGGTEGAETRVRIELTPVSDGTQLALAHTGFYTEPAARAARDAWPHVLAHLDEVLTAS